MKRTVALLTIGRSPRPDIRSDVEKGIDPTISIIERGALDSLSDVEARELRPESDDDALVASLGSGGQAIVSKSAIGTLLQRDIAALSKNVDGFAILCTGLFPALFSEKPLWQVGRLMLDAGAQCKPGSPIGVLSPIVEQIALNEKLWSVNHRTVLTAVASPYRGLAGVVDAAKRLQDRGASAIAMSCMTYSEEMRAAVNASTQLPTIGPSRILVDYINREWSE